MIVSVCSSESEYIAHWYIYQSHRFYGSDSALRRFDFKAWIEESVHVEVSVGSSEMAIFVVWLAANKKKRTSIVAKW
jgi:hypothetical protein